MSQRTYTLLAIALIAAAVAFAHYWPQYKAYFHAVNADAPVCAIGVPARCIKAREGA